MRLAGLTTALGAAAAAAILLLLAWTVGGDAVLQAWRAAFVAVAVVSTGSLALLSLHRVTGGRWIDPIAPALRTAATAIPALLLFGLPLAIWSGRVVPSGAAASDVQHLYLGPGWLVFRGTAGLVALSLLAVAAVSGRSNRAIAALTLIVFSLAMSVFAVDWILVRAPRFTSSAFGAEIAIQALLAALAFAVVTSPSASRRVAQDLAGLLLALALAVLYFDVMGLIVNWYGNQPERAAWYVARSRPFWLAIILVSLAISALIPLMLLLFGRVRQNGRALRLIAGAISLGLALKMFWFSAPDDPAPAVPAFVLALGLMGAAALAGARLIDRLRSRQAAHV